MDTPDPVKDLKSPGQVSSKTFPIAGILTKVYGLAELPQNCKSISCIWLLHGRLQKKEVMDSVAESCILAWNQRSSPSQNRGLIAVAFDQRNHGSREVHPPANQSWKDGNELHAQDMFSVFHGTASDVSLLINHLGSYVFHGPDAPSIDQHLVHGISLGGHAAWQVFFNEPRVIAAIVIIGCPDYMNLMEDRARLSKLNLQTSSSKHGNFFSSTYFPNALIDSVKRYDPRGLLFGTTAITTSPSSTEQSRLRPILDSRIKGKKILICSGGKDKLVPYRCGEEFLRFFKTATQDGGWYADGGVYVEDNVYPGVGHAYSEGMVRDTTRFVCDIIAGKSGAASEPSAKI